MQPFFKHMTLYSSVTNCVSMILWRSSVTSVLVDMATEAKMDLILRWVSGKHVVIARSRWNCLRIMSCNAVWYD
jgi:hypothetical protein